ncbi:hypothetical protein [Nitratireductor thuwali]|uniref:Uncharacterized protein n=1 Tax=Nitratireductor thuwali TaxID=2267699 RepID=A0ABY5MMG7_9HYPH|nr:hypothetical protein NTH_02816 [Nitratireductor thuwali]
MHILSGHIVVRNGQGEPGAREAARLAALEAAAAIGFQVIEEAVPKRLSGGEFVGVSHGT